MREYTQSDTEHGNCWQTAIACILEVSPDSLPPQVYWEQQPQAFNGWGGNYLHVLNGYLAVHYSLIYSELYDYQFRALQVKEPGYHLLLGPTVRSAEQQAKGFNPMHTVVAHYGTMVWDPHPSRVGLTYIERWGVLAPIPDRILKQRNELASRDADYKRVMIDCLCPEHYHYEA